MDEINPHVQMAKDEATIAELRDFLQQRKLEQNLSRPSSQEVAEQAAASAELSVEEVLDARDAESDRGVPAPSRCELSAEQQTELLRHMIAKNREMPQEATRASDSSVRIAGEDAAASVRSAGGSAEHSSDAASFKTAAGSWLSRRERRHQRSDAHRHETGREQVYLPPRAHA